MAFNHIPYPSSVFNTNTSIRSKADRMKKALGETQTLHARWL